MGGELGDDSNLLIVFYVQIMPDNLVMQFYRQHFNVLGLRLFFMYVSFPQGS